MKNNGVTMKITEYNINAAIDGPISIMLAADLHNREYKDIINEISSKNPDIIAVTGDIIEGIPADSPQGLGFLHECAEIAPTYYSLGNHEIIENSEDYRAIFNSGAILLNNTATVYKDIHIGGLNSGGKFTWHNTFKDPPVPDYHWINKFSGLKGYKILLCHHPEYYEPYIRSGGTDLILSGHAHGGQWRLFGRGIFAPGQGFFPKYTSGIYENRLVVSRGLANTAKHIPRLFNETELVYIKLNNNMPV